MEHPRLRRCSLAFAAFELVWIGVSVAMWWVDPYLVAIGALGQIVFAAIALLVAGVTWWRIRPRGRALAWLLAMPAGAALGIVVLLWMLSSIHWGC